MSVSRRSFLKTAAMGIVAVAEKGRAADVSKYLGRAGVAESSAWAVIRSQELALALDKSTGRVVALLDQQAKLDLQSNSSPRGLFTVGLSRPQANEHREVSALAFREVKVKTRAKGASAELTATFSGAADADLRVTCRFTVSPASPLIHSTVRVENHSDWCIPWVDFPSLVLNPQLGDSGEDDVLLIPTMGGEMFKNPSAEPVNVTAESLSMEYPGYASYQMLAFFDGTAGLYLATYDAEGNVKNYRAEMKGGALDLTPRHQGPEVAGAGFETEYATVLGSTRAPWYNAADRYKEWALEQFWCRKRLTERADVPDWLKTGPPFLLTYPRDGKLNALDCKCEPDQLVETVDLYRRTAGTQHIMYTSGGWEHQGVWLGPYYFPMRPSDAWWEAFCQKGGKRNIHVSLMTSGYKWTIKQNDPWAAPAFDYTEDFKRHSNMAITHPDGSPMLVGNADMRNFMGGVRSRICRGSKEGQDFMAAIFVNLARAGVEMSSFDQDIGGGERIPCYNPQHDHPPGFGKWMWESFRDLNARIQKETHPYVPQFVLYQEDEGELTIPWQATSWARDYRILDHPHVNAWGVPVFRYLYHEFQTCIGAALYVGSGANPAPETRAYAMARCLAYGLHNGEFATEIVLNAQGKAESVPSQAYFSFSRALAAYSEFLILGKMLRPLELRCRNTTLPFRRRLGRRMNSPTREFPLDLPAIVQGAYLSPGDRVGVILANPTGQDQQASLTLPDPYPGPHRLVREFRKQAEAKTHQAQAGGRIELSFLPLEAVFLRLD
jgi:Domain of unknown function (DUF6259)